MLVKYITSISTAIPKTAGVPDIILIAASFPIIGLPLAIGDAIARP